MQMKQVSLMAVMLLIAAACRQAAAGPRIPAAVKTTKLVTVTGVMLNHDAKPPKFKLPMFQHTTFSFTTSCSHCRDAKLTVKADAKGAPVITLVGPGPPPYNEKTTFTITTSPPTITVAQSSMYDRKKDIYRFKADITSFGREETVSFTPFTRRLAADSLGTVANNAATFIAWKHHFTDSPFPYSPHMRLVVAYLKHLEAISRG